ncbi:DUF1566 domain-containing protein [Crocinitomicaceae bacterium]|nr:DUF1566 domain-containing protein [Crocinitomicaceae bacterium]
MGLGIGISGPNGSEPCDDANVVNSDGTYDVDVAAGGTLTLPDINNIDSDGSTVVTPAQTPFVASPALDANVTNSDSSYNQAVASGATLTLPDISNIDSDGSVVVTPAQTPFVATACSGGSVGATLMKTGQLVSYATGDDGDIEAGRAVDFFTLPSNNPFGTTDRFTDYLGGQAYSIGVLIDWSTYDGNTVLGYSGSIGPGGYINWATAISYANNHSEGTFTSGWRLPNLKEWNNIFNLNIVYGFSFSQFTGNSFVGSWARRPSWLSSTPAQFTAGAYYADCLTGEVKRTSKTNASGQPAFAVRDFTVNGTILT